MRKVISLVCLISLLVSSTHLYKVQAKQNKKKLLGTFYVTAYCPCCSCSMGYGRHTASGKRAKAKRTIAVDYKNPVVRMGKKVKIGKRKYIVEDNGDLNRYGNTFDIFMDTHKETEKWGRRKVKVYLAR